MFAGIIERKGKLVKLEQQGKQIAFTFVTSVPWEKRLQKGESVSVNGVCLTAVSFPSRNQFVVQAVPETLAQTTLGALHVKDLVNLERSLKWGDRIGGHFVLGHVDGVGKITRKKSHGKSFVFDIELHPDMTAYLVPKGSIAIDGVSLTIQRIRGRIVSIAIIPHTAKHTILGTKKPGDLVNVEADVISKNLAQIVLASKL